MDWKVAITELRKPLDQRHVRPPPQGKYGEYIEGWHAIAEANRIFGEDGWCYDVNKLECTNQEVGDKNRVGYMAIVSVTALGVTRTDVGHGQGFGKSLGDAHDSALKEAVTDALKRALRTFGNPFGLALYDKTKANVVDVAAQEQAQAGIDHFKERIAMAETMAELKAEFDMIREKFGRDIPKELIDAKDARKFELDKKKNQIALDAQRPLEAAE